MNGGCRLPVFSGHPQAVSVAVPELAAIDVILAFLLTGVLLGVLQLLGQTNRTCCVTVICALINKQMLIDPPCVKGSSILLRS